MYSRPYITFSLDFFSYAVTTILCSTTILCCTQGLLVFRVWVLFFSLLLVITFSVQEICTWSSAFAPGQYLARSEPDDG